MLTNYFDVWELAEVLDIDEVSAKEILTGTLALEADELIELADHKGISVDQLIKASK